MTDQKGKITAEYVWIGGTMADMRSKSRTLAKIPKGPEVRRACTPNRVSLACTGGLGTTAHVVPRRFPHVHPRFCAVQELPTWNYDGSSTGQAPGHDSEVYMIPRAIFKDPFR